MKIPMNKKIKRLKLSSLHVLDIGNIVDYGALDMVQRKPVFIVRNETPVDTFI